MYEQIYLWIQRSKKGGGAIIRTGAIILMNTVYSKLYFCVKNQDTILHFKVISKTCIVIF